MKLLDLFCGAGGAGEGYRCAGFEVTGVDIKPQPRYKPGRFIQADALEYLAVHGHEYDVIHASPPCEFGTGLQYLGTARNGEYPKHINMIPDTRKALERTGRPYIIENVAGSRRFLRNPLMLCGKQFLLKTYRHRYFEIEPFFIMTHPHIPHRDNSPSAGNGKSPKGYISVCGTGGVRGMTSDEILAYWSYAMGIDWMEREELAKAIPPAYTEWIGRQVMKHLHLEVTP
jgi:DNA (cytosine-5)-methyltransferase 1